MSLARQAGRISPDDPKVDSLDDPFRLGWRYVRRTLPNGEVEVDEIPLTPEDLLFPEEGDVTVQLRSHNEDCSYLYGALNIRFAGVPGVLILADHRVRFDVPDLEPLGPDISVFLDVNDEWRTGTFDVAELDATPTLVVEVTSPDTRSNDVEIKKTFYHQAGVAYYIIIDPRIDQGLREEVQLLGFHHTPDGYEPVPLDDQGRLWVGPLDLGLTIEEKQVMCIDGRDGRRIEPPVAMALARKTAEERAEVAEAQARVEADARLVAEARTKAETDARIAVEAQLAALHAEILRLKGEG